MILLLVTACGGGVEMSDAGDAIAPMFEASSEAASEAAADSAVDALPHCPNAGEACTFKSNTRLCEADGGPHYGCDPNLDGGTWIVLEASPCTEYCSN